MVGILLMGLPTVAVFGVMDCPGDFFTKDRRGLIILEIITVIITVTIMEIMVVMATQRRRPEILRLLKEFATEVRMGKISIQ